MPGINELEQLSKSYSLAIGLMVIACIFLAYAVIRLYRENQQLWGRISQVLEERTKTLESMLAESFDGRNHS
jgi:hypothetical protein